MLLFFEKSTKCTYTKEKEIQAIRILSSVCHGDTQRVPSWVPLEAVGAGVHFTGNTGYPQRGNRGRPWKATTGEHNGR